MNKELVQINAADYGLEESKAKEEKAELELQKQKEAREKAEAELELKRQAEEREKQAQEDARQRELNKDDAARVKDLLQDLEGLKTKYLFKSLKNQKIAEGVSGLLDKIIDYIVKNTIDQ